MTKDATIGNPSVKASSHALRQLQPLTFLALFILLASCVPSVYDTPYPVAPVPLPQATPKLQTTPIPTSTPTAQSTASRAVISLSEDDAAHPAPIEWWYYTGHIEDENGNLYGFEVTFFKAYTPPRFKILGMLPVYWLIDRGHVAHVAITDLNQSRFVMGQKADFHGYDADAATDTFAVYVGDWRAQWTPDGRSHTIYAKHKGYELNLTLTPTKPLARHGNPPGIQSMGPGGTSYYISYTNMDITGTLSTDCRVLSCPQKAVSGVGWHDHQWGDFDLSSYAGWDWFSVQFADNTELMLYLIRQPNGTYSDIAGSYIAADGTLRQLKQEDIVATPTGQTWQSEDTGAIYPLYWNIAVPKFDIDIAVSPLLEDQEMNTRATTGIVYWEGAMAVRSNTTDKLVGKAYMELTNYDHYPYGKTDDTTPLKPLRAPFN